MYDYDWGFNCLVITPIALFLLSTIIIRSPQLHHLCAVALCTLVGGIFGCFPYSVELFRDTFRSEVLLGVYCPMVIIKLIYAVDMYLFAKSIFQIVIVSTIGFGLLVISIGLVTDFTISKLYISVRNCFLFGMLYSVSDVPEIVSKTDAVKNMELIIVGESFISLASTNVVLEILIGVYGGYINEYYHVIGVYIRIIGGALLLGVVCGYIFAFLLRQSYSDLTNAMLVILAASYFGYCVAEEFLRCSGVVTSGMIIYIMSQERTTLSPQVDAEVKEFLNEVFEVVLRISVILICLVSMIDFMERISFMVLIVGLFGYFIQITFRSIIFTFLTSILSRMGYGFNLSSLIIMIWRPFRGPVPLLLLLKCKHEGITSLVDADTINYIYVYYVLQLSLNRYLQTYTLDKLNLDKISSIHQNNMSNAIKLLQNRRDEILSSLKTSRYFSGANWSLINNMTLLLNPYEPEDDNLFENIFSYSMRMTTCPKCFQRLHVQPTKAEIRDISRAVKTRILKAQRVSFVQQYETGYLNKDQMNELLYAVDVALDSDDLFIRVDDIFREVREPILIYHIRMCLKRYQEREDLSVPEGRFKSECYRICNHTVFHIVSFLLTVVLVTNEIEAMVKGRVSRENVLVAFFVHLLLLSAFGIIFNSYNTHSFTQSLQKYFSFSWNGIDFTSLTINTVNIYVTTFRYCYNLTEVSPGMAVLKSIACIRIVKMFKYIVTTFPKLATLYNKKIDRRAYASYIFGKAILVSYEEVVHQLRHLADDQSIKEALKIRLNSDKIAIMEQLSLLQKNRPWIPSSVETKQSIKCTLKSMKVCVYELKHSGIIDNYEFRRMMISLDEIFSKIDPYMSIETISPSQIFSEIPWAYDDGLVHEYLYSHVQSKIFSSGEIVCYNGEILDTIIIVVEGILKSYYKPDQKVVQFLMENGQLPVKELISRNNFLDEQTDFLLIGNIMGELAILTERECSNTTVCYLSARALVLPKKIVCEAMKLNPNPVSGLWSRLWKKVTFNLVLRMLLDPLTYESATIDKTKYLLNDAFIPNLKNFKTLELCEYVLDVVLVNGMLVDVSTEEVYRAPCCMPRTVQKYAFIENSNTPVLWVIPEQNVEPMDLMYRFEQDSELYEPLDTTLLANNFIDIKRIKTLSLSKKKSVPDETPVHPDSQCRCRRRKNASQDKENVAS